MAIDASGLPIAKKGAIETENAGALVAAVETAARIHNDKESPVLVIDVADGESIMVKQKQFITIAVQKKQS